MFDIGWPELIVICVVALVVVGPEDLPRIMHTLGVWTGKARRLFLALEGDLERMAQEAEALEKAKRNQEKPASKDEVPPPVPQALIEKAPLPDGSEEGEEAEDDDESQ